MALATLPFALIGGVAAVVLTNGVLSLGSIVGFVTVLGVAAPEGTLVISPHTHPEGAGVLTTGVLSLGSIVGFVTVLGIAARNGILLISHYRHLEDAEGVPFG